MENHRLQESLTKTTARPCEKTSKIIIFYLDMIYVDI